MSQNNEHLEKNDRIIKWSILSQEHCDILINIIQDVICKKRKKQHVIEESLWSK
jgi:hypothetical protein